MFKRVSQERIFCGLDLGTQKLKAAVLKVAENNVTEFLGVYDVPIQGFKESGVSNLEELSGCIHSTLTELSKRSQTKIKDVQLGLSGDLIETREVITALPLIDKGSKVIVNRDIKKINHQAKLLGLKMDEEILHELPQYYQVDDVNTALNPAGLYGRKLGVCSLMVMTHVNRIQNIVLAVTRGGYDVDNIFFSGLAGAEVVLSDDDKLYGAIVVDIGCSVSNVLIFKDRGLKFLGKIDMGGDAVTKSIAAKLNVSFTLAEEIKRTYADVSLSLKHSQEEILIKRDNAYVPLRRDLIYQAIEPLTNEFLQNLQNVLQKSALFHHIDRGVIVIGGGALLNGLMERMEEFLSIPVRLGKINIPMQKTLNQACLYAPVIGLAQSGLVKKSNDHVFRNGHKDWTQFAVSKMRELYQEYF